MIESVSLVSSSENINSGISVGHVLL